MSTIARPEPMLWLSDARGSYIPRDFATSFADRIKDMAIVNHEQYVILEACANNEMWRRPRV